MISYSEDIELIKQLYLKNKVEMFFFHEKYMLSPAQLARTIRKHLEKELIVVNRNEIELTEKGKKWVLANRKDLFLKEKRKYWKEVPSDMKQEPLSVNELYEPKKIDIELLKLTEDGK